MSILYSRSDSGQSNLWSKTAGTSYSQIQKKALSELCRPITVGRCELCWYKSYSHFKFFPYKFQLNENVKQQQY